MNRSVTPMSHKFFGEHGKRYAQCVVCLRVLKWGQRSRTLGSWSRPFLHCEKPVKFITDVEAREIVKRQHYEARKAQKHSSTPRRAK